MDEKTLLRIAMAAAIFGVGSLLFLAQKMKADEAMISRLDMLVDEEVIITGVVLDLHMLEKVTFLRIEKSELTEVVLFGPVPLVAVGDLVQVRGKVVEQEGEVELIGEEVRVI